MVVLRRTTVNHNTITVRVDVEVLLWEVVYTLFKQLLYCLLFSRGAGKVQGDALAPPW